MPGNSGDPDAGKPSINPWIVVTFAVIAAVCLPAHCCARRAFVYREATA